MKSKLLDRDKVIDAIELAEQRIFFTHNMSYNADVLTDLIKKEVASETRTLIQEAFHSFAYELRTELLKCEPEKYPCALCHEEESNELLPKI